MLTKMTQTQVNAQQKDGATALILVARLSIDGAMKHLLACGVDINLTDKYGELFLVD